MIHFVVPASHDRCIREYLEVWGRDLESRIRVVHVESLPALTGCEPGTYVLAALDQMQAGTSAFVAALHESLVGRDDVRFLNHPSRTWRRPRLLDELHRRGSNEFRAVPISADLAALRYPVFLRDWRSHDGALSPLLRSPAEVQAAIGRVLIQGWTADDLLVVEFCDSADPDGYYRKYAAFVVGGRVIPRSLSISRDWMLKFSGGEFTSAKVEEELEYVLTNPHEAALTETFSLASVDYGRIDYSIKDGRLQTWEINLNPTIGRGLRPSSGRVPPELETLRRRVKEHFYRCFREAWESVDLAPAESAPIEVDIPESVRRAALEEARSEPRDRASSGWLSTLRRVLRPAKPVVAPLVAPVLPWIGRVARRRMRR